MNNVDKNKIRLKQKILHEVRLYFLYASFLTLFFFSMTTYRKLILGEYSINYTARH
jgi:hypothetical protein